MVAACSFTVLSQKTSIRSISHWKPREREEDKQERERERDTLIERERERKN
jgi:hypothetical protein